MAAVTATELGFGFHRFEVNSSLKTFRGKVDSHAEVPPDTIMEGDVDAKTLVDAVL